VRIIHVYIPLLPRQVSSLSKPIYSIMKHDGTRMGTGRYGISLHQSSTEYRYRPFCLRYLFPPHCGMLHLGSLIHKLLWRFRTKWTAQIPLLYLSIRNRLGKEGSKLSFLKVESWPVEPWPIKR